MYVLANVVLISAATFSRSVWATQKSRTLARRVRYNRAAAMQGTRGKLTGDLSVLRGLRESQRC